MKEYMKVRAEIDLDAIRHNLDVMQEIVGNDVKMIPVVKADSYGHGSVMISRELEPVKQVWGFAVAQAEEGVILRKGGITKPILLLGGAFPDVYDLMIKNDIRACISSFDQAAGLSERAFELGKCINVHIAVDTGMSRIGFQVTDRAADEVVRISKLPGIKIEGAFTHFARADEAELKYARKQAEGYDRFISMLSERGIDIEIKHVSNSAAIFNHTNLTRDAVRPGITLYGLSPSGEMSLKMQEDGIDFHPVMSLKSRIIFLKEIEEGRAVSYGGIFVAKKRTKIATVPVGYADGYPRQLSNKGYVLIGGKRAPICGRVCMDQFMIDVTDIEDVNVGDEVVLLGRSGSEKITAEELGDLSGRFNYELVCCISKRVPRNYMRGGAVISQVDYFDLK
ncbi:MAG: alanine racemase [Lachnospiraceae bacterium]|jgi:alanine racemase